MRLDSLVKVVPAAGFWRPSVCFWNDSASLCPLLRPDPVAQLNPALASVLKPLHVLRQSNITRLVRGLQSNGPG